jgi:hypothetical protein
MGLRRWGLVSGLALNEEGLALRQGCCAPKDEFKAGVTSWIILLIAITSAASCIRVSER